MGSRKRIIWLKTNQRACGVLLAATGTITLVGGAMNLITGTIASIGIGLAICGLAFSAIILWHMMTPRLASDDRHLLVYAGGWRPFRVPLEIVEVFFLGQGPSMLPQSSGNPIVNSTVVVRLAEAAKDWHKRDTNKRLAHWCEGYITLRG
ncbi:MAG: hypothetical protein KDB27_35115, partial [Planctomycetales bacterium]|nr:hypothetical protein [Planctomycetales bacterium]